jgi:hypothetical protein
MTMGTKSTEIKDGSRILEILSGIQDEITKLKELPETMKALNNRVASLETQNAKMNDTPASPRISGDTSSDTQQETKELELRDTRISELESQVAILQSSEYRENMILEWLSNPDQDSNYTLGVRKCFLEESKLETQLAHGELRDPSPEVLFSKEKPEDLTGWTYSKTLNCYVKLEGGMNE